MIVVSDTSALWTLCAIGKADLLPALFGRVLVPNAVAAEFTRARTVKGKRHQFPLPAFVEVVPVADAARVAGLRAELDAGESEAIALALELRADLVLMDERDGRAVAGRLGLKITGVVGVVALAKRRGLISEIGSLLKMARDQFGFHLSDQFLARVLAEHGEPA